MKNPRLVTGLALALLIVIFIAQNTAVTEFRLLFWTLAMSRALMLFFLVGLGIACGWFLHSYYARRKGH